MPKNVRIINDPDPSKLIKKKSIFANLSTTNFFRDINATGFTKNKTSTEYKKIENNDFINSGVLSKGTHQAVNFFSGIQGKWGPGTFPKGFTINQQYTNFFGDGYNLVIPSLRHIVGSFTLDTQLHPGSILFNHIGFNKKLPYLKPGHMFGENSLTSNSLFDKTKLNLDNINIGDMSFDYMTNINVYGGNVFKIPKFTNDIGHINRASDYVSAFTLFTQLLPGQDENGILPYLTFKDGSNLNQYYKKAASSNQILSILNNPSRARMLSSEPYIRTIIGDRYGATNDIDGNNIYVENGDTLVSSGDFLIRGGIQTAVSRTLEDTIRISKFLISPRGLLFATKQTALQLTSPRPETNPNGFKFVATLGSLEFGASFMLNTLDNIEGAAFGIHRDRHATLFEYGKKYEDSTEVNKDKFETDNRLVYLKNLLNFPKNYEYGLIPLRGLTTPGVSNDVHKVFGIPGTSTLGADGFKRAVNSTEIYTTQQKTKYKYKTYHDIYINAISEESVYEKNRLEKDKNDFEFHTKISDLTPAYLAPSFESSTNNTNKIHNLPTYKSTVGGKGNNADGGWGKDPITSIDSTTDEEFDIITLKFKPYGNRKMVIFRAIISTFQDSHSPSYSSINYVGNPIHYPVYQNTKRSINISFKVPVYKRNELSIIYTKLNVLASYCWPAVAADFQRIATPFIQFTYGGLVKCTTAVITSLNYTVDSNIPWDIDAQLPHVVDVSINMDIIPDAVPFMSSDGESLVNWFIAETPTKISCNATNNSTKLQTEPTLSEAKAFVTRSIALPDSFKFATAVASTTANVNAYNSSNNVAAGSGKKLYFKTSGGGPTQP